MLIVDNANLLLSLPRMVKMFSLIILAPLTKLFFGKPPNKPLKKIYCHGYWRERDNHALIPFSGASLEKGMQELPCLSRNLKPVLG